MGACINFVCDHQECTAVFGHTVRQPVFFDHLHETWGDVIKLVELQGWQLKLDNGRVLEAICPLHGNAILQERNIEHDKQQHKG